MTPPSTPTGGPMIGHLIHVNGKPPVSIFLYFFFSPFFFSPFRLRDSSGERQRLAWEQCQQNVALTKQVCTRFLSPPSFPSVLEFLIVQVPDEIRNIILEFGKF